MRPNRTEKDEARRASMQQETVPSAAHEREQYTMPAGTVRRARQHPPMNTYPSVPAAIAPAAPDYVPEHPAQPPARAARRTTAKAAGSNWWLIGAAGIMIGLVSTCLALTGWIGILYMGGDILPGVHSFGVDLGGKSEAQAVAVLDAKWHQGITLADQGRSWQIDAASLGIWLDSEATAEAARQEGRSSGNLLRAIMGKASVPPVVEIDLTMTYSRLTELAPQFESPAINAGIQLVDGEIRTTPPQPGRLLDVNATIAALQDNAGQVLADGVLELVMIPVQPTVIDATPMVAQASQLLLSPLQITAFDPVRNEKLPWSLPPAEWSRWLVAESDPNSPTGLALTLETTQLASYLAGQAGSLGTDRYLKVDEAAAAVAQAISANQTSAYIRVYHHDTQHTVRAGETFSSIAYDYGIPYPWIQQANPGVSDALSVGQTITVPSPDNLLPLPIVYHKRIIVSISQQRLWAYEHDQLVWHWIISTGIAESPTSPGIFQIQSHEPNAYAGNWNLWMPNFMGVYRPVPTSEFMNGFHGFPTRGSSQLLWTNSLGHPVTYGCILVSDENVVQLYNWAEEGTVVEIQR